MSFLSSAPRYLVRASGARQSALLPFRLDKRNAVPLDLTAQNPRLLQMDLKDTAALHAYVSAHIRAAGARAAVGGYNEDRVLYRRSEHFGGPEPRTVHLGVDVWTDAGTPVCAPLDGRVHSFRDNAGFGDYGPTIILEHRLPGGTFFSLYGHLSRASLHGLRVGQAFGSGQPVGEIGPYPENGDWPPHLHFQLMTDMLGLEGDFPGVAAPSQRSRYLAICPDPAFLLLT
jgi:murein DD-endopeptidase MepM/ murein hydrolase activator NlpD